MSSGVDIEDIIYAPHEDKFSAFGEVTTDTSLLVYSVKGLISLSTLVNSINDLPNIDFTNLTEEWAPIGNDTSQFMGTFDGNGYIISNLTIAGDIQYADLIGCVGSEGVVKNVDVVDSSIDVTTYSGTLKVCVESIANNNETTKNSYTLQTGSINYGIFVTSDELKSTEILTTLDGAYKANILSFNNGYPLLSRQIILHTISFDSQGGSTIESQTVEKGQTAVISDTPAKDDNIFWYWASNDEEFDFSSAINSDLTLTAIWYDKLVFTSMPGGIA